MEAPEPEEVIRIVAHGLEWQCVSGFADALPSVDVLRLRETAGLREGEVVKDNKARTVARLSCPGRSDGPALYVKRFKPRGTARRLKGLLGRTQAGKEWEMSRAFQQRGIPTEGVQLIQKVHRDQSNGMVGKIELEIQVPPGFPQKYLPSLVRSAELCAVKKHMEQPPEFEIYTSEKMLASQN